MSETLIPLLGAACTVVFAFEMARLTWRSSRSGRTQHETPGRERILSLRLNRSNPDPRDVDAQLPRRAQGTGRP